MKRLMVDRSKWYAVKTRNRKTMTAVDMLGWLATTVVIISFTVKDMLLLRIVNAIGATLWLIYAGLRGDIPLLVVNVLILAAHAYWYYKNK